MTTTRRGRTTASQQELENGNREWSEGALKEPPGDNIEQAADGEKPAQPYLPGQAPTLLDRQDMTIKLLEEELGVIDDRFRKAQGKHDEASVLKRRELETARLVRERLLSQMAQEASDASVWPGEPTEGVEHTVVKDGWRHI